jgi:hypothetical protein
MHHLHISSIVKTLDDYFAISDPESSTTIKGQNLDWGSDDSLVISRKLKNGRLEIHIKGEEKDDDHLDVVYYQQGSTKAWDEKCEVHHDLFQIEAVRKAIRKLVIHDANPPELECSDEDEDN